MSEPDWDTYYCKHCARLYGWLSAAKEYKEQHSIENIKYFTLCDIKAIDVFMFEMEGILGRDENGKLPNVLICEEIHAKVPEIRKIICPPLKDAVIAERLQDLLTFEDDDYTRSTPTDSWERDPAKRKRLRTKRNVERLKKYMPFDIINFDPNDNLLNPGLATNRLYQALKNVFNLQEATERFLLLVTTPLQDIAQSTEDKFKGDLTRNVSQYPGIRDALLSAVQTVEYKKIKARKRFAYGFAKSVVLAAAREKGWVCEHKGIHIYENEYGHRYLSSVVLCRRANVVFNESAYSMEIAHVIAEMPSFYSYSQSLNDQVVTEHLRNVVLFREQSRLETSPSN